MILVILRCWRLLLLLVPPCEILFRSDFTSIFASLIWGWTSVLKANDLIFKSFGKPSTKKIVSLRLVAHFVAGAVLTHDVMYTGFSF